jgi:hypothetical protein
MTLSRYATLTVLALIYVVAVGARLHTGTQTSPYFHGASAMNYRHAMAVADGHSLTASTNKANWPDGYRPAAYRASGVEYFAGYTYKVVHYFSNVDGRVFVRRFVVLLFSLCVFTLYAFVRRLWDCQAAGLLAAGLVAAFVPLVHATNGREFGHTPFAILLITVHALALLDFHRRGKVASGVAAAAVGFLLVAAWELGVYYVAAALCVVVFVGARPGPGRVWVTGLHAVAVVSACALLPYLRGTRAAFSWPVVLTVLVAAAEFLPGRLGRPRRALAVAVATLVLTAILSPLRAGASESVPVVGYAWTRLRFLFAKPTSPQLLPDAIRALWSVDHAPPSAAARLDFFLPLAFFAVGMGLAWRERMASRRTALLTTTVAGAAAVVAFALDRSAVALAAVAVLPALASVGVGFRAAARSRAPVVAVGAYLVLAQLVFPYGAANPVFQIEKSSGVALRDPDKFLWVGLEDTDKGLVRFVATRTAVANPFLSSTDLTALLLTFSGRTSVPLPGAIDAGHLERNARLAHAVYEDEAHLYETCRRLGVRYVVYSIDMFLDTTKYSPCYLAGLRDVSPESAAFQMQFHPESLHQFTLVYENEHHRLFKVTPEQQPVFLTDHPPVYQFEVFDRVARDVPAFRQRVIDLMISYHDAREAAYRGEYDVALKKLDWCLEVAPRFTLARIAKGTTLSLAGRFEEARDVLLSVLEYAPDNPNALYHAAYALAALGETDRAREYLDVFFTTAKDKELIEKGRMLKTFIEQGVPVTPGAIPE